MSDLFRTFVAVDVIPGNELTGVINDLREFFSGEVIKWSDIRDMHLTLKFLGNTRPETVSQIKSVLSDIINEYRLFTFRLTGLGYFKRDRAPKVIFAKVIEGDKLQKLAEEMDVRLSETGFERESRPFNPHLTIARIKNLKNRSSFDRFMSEYDNYPFQDVIVKEIILYRSILTPRGPNYKKLAVFNLK